MKARSIVIAPRFIIKTQPDSVSVDSSQAFLLIIATGVRSVPFPNYLNPFPFSPDSPYFSSLIIKSPGECGEKKERKREKSFSCFPSSEIFGSFFSCNFLSKLVEEEMGDLMPGLPDDIARQCLLRVTFDAFHTVRSVCRLWKQELESPSFHRLRRSSGLSCPVVALAQAEPAFATGGPAQKYAASSTPSYRLVLFSPATGTWGSLPPIPSLPYGLPLFCQLAAVGRELVVVGGWDPATWAASDKVYVYNFESGTWRRGARMPAPRRSFFACAASDSARTVFVAGGHDEEKNALKSALVYDVASNAWAPLPDMSRERDECAGVILRGRFQVIGGYATETQGQFGRSAEAFDTATWSWAPVEEEVLEGATCPRRCVAGGDGRLYVCRAAGKVAVREAEGEWREVAEVAEDARVAQQLVAWDRELMVMGSACHGGALACYISELNRMMTTTWRKVEVPAEYSGHVQAGCCLEI